MRGEKEGKGIVWKEREGRADKRCLLNPKSREGGMVHDGGAQQPKVKPWFAVSFARHH